LENQVNDQKKVVPQGPPWKIIKKFVSFEAADQFRNNHVSENPNKQVKVRRYSNCFVVKDRNDPALAPQKEKKGRKTKKKGKKSE
tara:strand:+ start:5087 stop:5341 length:255 start_codon:yes stop_codon:yes gene_type:complete